MSDMQPADLAAAPGSTAGSTAQPAAGAAYAQLAAATEQQLQSLQLMPTQQLSQQQQQQQQEQDASAQPPYEQAWAVLLAHIVQWDSQECYEHLSVSQPQQLICKLLCCSHAMTDVVYRACTGELRFSMQLHYFMGAVEGSTDDGRPSLSRQKLAGRWLARHAQLLGELHVSADQRSAADVEAAVASGLRAAAGRSRAAVGPGVAPAGSSSSASSSTAWRRGMGSLRKLLRQQAPPAQPQQQLPQQQQQQQQQQQEASGIALSRLLLKCASFQLPCSGSMLCALAGSRQLTSLSMDFGHSPEAEPAAECQVALQSLASLRELTLNLRYAGRDDTVLRNFAPGLSPLKQLSKLILRHGNLTQDLLNCLPASVVELEWEPPIPGTPGDYRDKLLEFSHLAGLTKLDMRSMMFGDIFPPSLRTLNVWSCDPGTPLARLTELESFNIVCIPDAALCSQLNCIATLRGVRIGCGVGLQYGADPNDVASQLASLPLVEVKLRTSRPLSPDFVSSMRHWTRLERLHLTLVHIDGSFKDLSEQLLRLPELQQLWLDQVTACRGERWLYRELPEHMIVSDLQAFMRNCGCMPKLERLNLHRVHVGRALVELVPGPMLSNVFLTECSIDADTEAAARAKWAGAARLFVSTN